MAHVFPKTNRGKVIMPALPNTAVLLWMELDNGNLRLDEADRSQYLIKADVIANDGRHSEEIPIVKAATQQIVGVIHLHWDRHRNLQYMHAKDHMLAPGKYAIPFNDEFWEPIVRNVIR